MTASWHAGPDLLERYAASTLDEARAASIEAHVMRCARCREALAHAEATLSLGEPLARIWNGVEARSDPIRRGVAEHLLVRAGVAEHVARLLAATRSLRLSWLAANALALAFAVAAAYAGTPGLMLFLTVAPLVPLAGVSAAYGPGVDPAYEVGVAAPMRSFRLLLVRSTAVLVASMALAGLASLALPRLDWSAAAWLLPSLGLTLASLALSTYIGPVRAAAGVTGVWVVAVLVTEAWAPVPLVEFRGAAQVAFAVVAIGAGVILSGRAQSLERRRT
jgi:hypothetical protein